MKNYALLLMTLSIFSTIANASDVWSRFSCKKEGSNKNLLFIPETTYSHEQQCTFFDGKNVWNHRVITANQNFYSISLHSGCSHAYLEPGALSSIEFKLPPDRRIIRRQEGGYYVPVMRTIPFTFDMQITGRDDQGEEIFSESYACHGID